MSDFVKVSHVYLNNSSANVDEALAFLSDKAVELGIAEDRDAVLAAFKEREAEGTTGMMGGFAIPHAKSDAIKDAAILVVKFAGDVEWESMDGKPIHVAIALLVPGGEAGTTHLKLLSKVAVLLMDDAFRSAVLAAAAADAIADAVNKGLAE